MKSVSYMLFITVLAFGISTAAGAGTNPETSTPAVSRCGSCCGTSATTSPGKSGSATPNCMGSQESSPAEEYLWA